MDEVRAETDVPKEWMGAVQPGAAVQLDVACADQEEDVTLLAKMVPAVVALVIRPADSRLAMSQEA